MLFLPLPHLGLPTHQVPLVPPGLPNLCPHCASPSGLSLSSQDTTPLLQTLPTSWMVHEAPDTPCICPQCGAFLSDHFSVLNNQSDPPPPLCKDNSSHSDSWIMSLHFSIAYMVFTSGPSLTPSPKLGHSSHTHLCHPGNSAQLYSHPPPGHSPSADRFLGLGFFPLFLCETNAC